MKKLAAVLLCVGLCIAIGSLYPQVGTANLLVNEEGCLECHALGSFDGEGLHGTHSGLSCASCHEEGMGELGNVNSSSCAVCHPVGDPGSCNLVNLHPASCLECHEDCAVTEGCVVTIACEETELCPDDDCTTCTATTECDGMEADGMYTWSLNGAGTTGNTGDSIEICPEDLEMGDNTLMVVDTANDNAEDTETLTLEECGPTDCAIDVLTDSISKSHWRASPAVFRIETIGIDPLTALTPVTIACDADGDSPLFTSVLKTGKYVQPNLGTNTTVIWQTALIWPAWWTQSLGLESETCTVTVGDCPATDTFELEYRWIFGIPLGN
jgi:hypothetical protein